MKKIFWVSFFLIIISIASTTYISAAKRFVRKKNIKPKTVSNALIPASVKYRGDKQGILMSFSNFRGINSVSYSFTYLTNNNPQGAGGTISASNNPTAQRELLFGTCSTSVCTYHHNLTNARLVLTAKMTNGRTISKSYRIKTYQ